MKILISGNWSPLKLVCELLSEPETLSLSLSRLMSVALQSHRVTCGHSPRLPSVSHIVHCHQWRKIIVTLHTQIYLKVVTVITGKNWSGHIILIMSVGDKFSCSDKIQDKFSR